MKKSFKKIISFVLAFALIVTSITVFDKKVNAAETFANVVGVAEDDGTISVQIGSKPDGWTMIEAYVLEGAHDENATVTADDAAVNSTNNWNWNTQGRVYGGVNGDKVNKIVKNAAGTELKAETLYTVILIAYTGEALGDSTTEIDRVAVQVTTKAKQEIIAIDDATEVVEQEVQTVPADDSEAWIPISNNYGDTMVDGAKGYVSKNVNGNDGVWGFYDEANKGNNWNGVSETVIYNEPVFSFVRTHGESIVIGDNSGTGTKYTSPRNKANKLVWVGGNDCVYINQSLLTAPAGQTKIYSVTINGNDSFLIKIVGKVEETTTQEVGPNQTIPSINWVGFPGNVGDHNSKFDTDGNTVEISDNAITEGSSFLKTADIYGPYDDVENVPYVRGDNTVLGPVLAFAVTDNNLKDKIKSVWIDGVKYTKGESVYFGGDQVYLKEDLFKYTSGDSKITYVTLRGDEDKTFAIRVSKTEEPTTEEVTTEEVTTEEPTTEKATENPNAKHYTLDGVEKTINPGETLVVPDNCDGYTIAGIPQVFAPGYEIEYSNIYEGDVLSTVNITVGVANGAAIKVDKNADKDAAGHIRFQCSYSNTAENDGFYNEHTVNLEFGGIIATKNVADNNEDIFDLTKSAADGQRVVIPNTNRSFANDNKFFIALDGITSGGYAKKYVAKTYVRFTRMTETGMETVYKYSDGTSSTEGRSIASVATAIVNNNYGSYTDADDRALLDYFASFNK